MTRYIVLQPGDRVLVAALPRNPGRHRVTLGEEGVVIGHAENETRLTVKFPGRYVLVPSACLALLPVQCTSKRVDRS